MTYFYDDGYDVMIKQGDGYLQGWKDSCPKKTICKIGDFLK